MKKMIQIIVEINTKKNEILIRNMMRSRWVFQTKSINRFEDKNISMYALGMTTTEIKEQIHKLF